MSKESVENRRESLHIFVVSGGQTLHRGEEARHLTHHTPTFASEKLECIWVLFLWHEARACGVGVRHPHETKLSCRKTSDDSFKLSVDFICDQTCVRMSTDPIIQVYSGLRSNQNERRLPEQKMMRSSDHRLRCTIVIDAQNMNSAQKSRSLTYH